MSARLPTAAWLRLAIVAAALALVLGGCFDFHGDLLRCEDAGHCALPDDGDGGDGIADGGDAGTGGGDAGPDVVPDAGPGGEDAGPDGGAIRFGQPYYSCDEHGWCWDRPWPQGYNLNAVSGTAADLWAAGDNGILLHVPLDGGVPQLWSQTDAGGFYSMNGIFADGTDVIAVGESFGTWRLIGMEWHPMKNPQDAHYDGVLGVDGLFFATGNNGNGGAILAVSDGGAFQDIALDGGYPFLYAISGPSAQDLWAGGSGGNLLHVVDGVPYNQPPISTADVFTVHATAPDSIWAGTAAGELLHSDGGGVWTTVVTRTSDLRSVTGTSDDDIWENTAYGFAHCTPAGCDDETQVWGYLAAHSPQPGLLFMAGINGGIAVYDGALHELISPSTPPIYGLAQAPSGELVAVGDQGSMAIRGSNGWRSLTPVADPVWLRDLCFDGRGWGWIPASDNAVYRLGEDGGLRNVGLVLPDGGAPGSPLTAIACSGNDVWGAGQGGGIGHASDGGRLVDVVAPTGSQANLNGVWMSDAGYVVAVGNAGTVVVTDGGETITTTPFAGINLQSVFGFGPDDLWACGDNGILGHWTGSSWRTFDMNVAIGQGSNLYSVWGHTPGEVWAAGGNGIVVHVTNNGATLEDFQELNTRSRAKVTKIVGIGGHLWLTEDTGAVQVLP